MHRLRICQTFIWACSLFAAAVSAAQKPAPQQQTIQDPAELKAYSEAIQTPDPTARAEALAAFVQDYPKSIALTEALDEEMAAWQASGDSSQVIRVARSLVALDPGNVRALGIVVALERVKAAAGDNDALNQMCVDASGGMLAVPMWHQPANMSAADYVSLSKLLSDVFVGAEGYCAVEQKNYSQAKDWLGRALKIDPTNVQDNYQLGVADLESTPLDVDGFWYCAHAIQLAKGAAIPQDAESMAAYCKAQFVKFHGADDGWDALLASVANVDAPPADFAKQIKAAAGATQK